MNASICIFENRVGMLYRVDTVVPKFVSNMSAHVSNNLQNLFIQLLRLMMQWIISR